ncbi:MAG: amidohydrolase [Lachnospiraceae bacterium]
MSDNIEQIKEILCQTEEELASWGEEISTYIFEHPELSDLEFESSKYLTKKLKEKGFEVVFPYFGYETAFRCEYGEDGGVKVAFLAEYDALFGYGKNHDEVAHACGHNWIAASSALAAVTLAKISKQLPYPCKVVLIGTPAEELYGRKVNLAKKGAFDDIDAVFQMHLGRDNCVDTTAMAITDFVFEFFGKAAHAAKEPENGINALDASYLTIAGLNAMRQQFGSDVKIHETITNGGQSPNIIPEYSSMAIFVRASNKEILERAAERVINIGKGAELMTGARLVYKEAENIYYDLKRYEWLNTLMKKNLANLGITDLRQGDIHHCESTDIGNVSYCCPTCYVTLSTAHISDAGLHESEFIEVANSKEVHKLLHIAAKAMAMTAVDIIYKEK